MYLIAWVTIASLLMYAWMFVNVGKARILYKIPAPSTDGPVEFVSKFRVQSNTVEQFILFLPLLWLCGLYMSELIAAILGCIWIIGRIIFALGYYKDPEKRHLGFGISLFASAGLLIGSITGLIIH